jgi:hypothetical protein
LQLFGKMGFVSKMLTTTVKTVLTPVAIVKDMFNIANGEEVEATNSLLESATDDFVEGLKDLSTGKLL